MNEQVYYSQNREDIILRGFFPDVEKGFYVDIGASHPSHFSVTKLFYDNGWSGMNVDANPSLVDALRAERTRDNNITIGISDKPGTLQFREFLGHGLSTFSDQIKTDYETTSQDEAVKQYRDYEVEVITLKQLFMKHDVTKIHFMKVDVEGFEYEVLAGNDWTKYRPEVVCIEANHIVKKWKSILTNNNYTLVFNDGLNEYYATIESGRQKMFDYVDAVISKQPIYIEEYDKRKTLEAALQANEDAALELEEAVQERDKEIARLHRISVMVRNLAHAINAMVVAKLQPQVQLLDFNTPLNHFNMPASGGDAPTLLSAVHDYDNRQYNVDVEIRIVPRFSTLRNLSFFLYRLFRKTLKLIYGLLRRAKG